MAQPTPKQISFLQHRGILAPPTKTAAHRFIDFIINGNPLAPQTADERIAELQAVQEMYCGKKVRSNLLGRMTTVSYITVASRFEVEQYVQMEKANLVETRNYFRARLENHVAPMSLAGLELIPE